MFLDLPRLRRHAARGLAAAAFLLPAATLILPACQPVVAQMPGARLLAADAAIPGNDPWFNHAVIYEIYPRSYQDSNGDGTGDMNGITQRLDHLKALGIDAIWIAPMFPSPQVDFGYDISDYRNVDPQYGTLADLDRLIAEAKKRNIRVMLDMVLNHSSDKHAWFQESMKSRTNPKADWYVWKDGIGPDKMTPPNNWQSIFGHSAWTYVPARKQFYYHKFYVEQPDLNWRNPAVEAAIFDMLKFWLDRGIAGFRLDAIPTLFENPDMKDEQVNLGPDGKEQKNAYGDTILHDYQTSNLPEVDDVERRMRALIDTYPTTGFPGARVLVGETYFDKISDLDKAYGGEKKDELQLPMDFQVGMYNKLDAAAFRTHIDEAETMIHGSQPLFVYDNHDNPRADRYCTAAATGGTMPTPAQCIAIQKLLATLLFTTKSAALMYYGDEIGMATTPPTRVEDVKDPIGRIGWPKEKGRDGERTPMQWTPGPQAGFTTSATPWLPIPPSYKTVNVQTEKGEPDSLLNWFRALIEARRSNPALHDGTITMLDTANSSVLSYVRAAGAKKVLVALNFTGQPQTVTLDGMAQASTMMTDAAIRPGSKAASVTLPAFGSWVGEVK